MQPQGEFGGKLPVKNARLLEVGYLRRSRGGSCGPSRKREEDYLRRFRRFLSSSNETPNTEEPNTHIHTDERCALAGDQAGQEVAHHANCFVMQTTSPYLLTPTFPTTRHNTSHSNCTCSHRCKTKCSKKLLCTLPNSDKYTTNGIHRSRL